MEDYSKLRVVDLKAELKKRGLPQGGLKQAMIDRLRNADAEADRASSGPGPSNEAGDQVVQSQEGLNRDASDERPPDRNDEDIQAHETVNQDVERGSPTRQDEEIAAESDARLAPTDPESTSPVMDTAQDTAPVMAPAPVETIETAAVPEGAQTSEPEGVIARSDGITALALDGSTDEKVSELPMPSEAISTDMTEAQPPADRMDTDKMPESGAAQATEVQEGLRSQEPEARGPNAGHESRSTSLDPEEAVNDARKRKRRSMSPVPSTQSIVQKKARLEDTRPRVHLEGDDDPQREDEQVQLVPSDRGMHDGSANQDAHEEEGDRMDVDRTEQMDVAQDSFIPDGGPPPQGTRSPSEHASAKDVVREPDGPLNGESSTSVQPQESKASPRRSPSPSKPSAVNPKANRYKDAFAGYGSMEKTLPGSPSLSRNDDYREITPALHPTTSALYIRELMRPLHPPTLKKHLIALATPQRASPDPNILKEFFLDQIRTHCFVAFANAAAASRVRSALHNAIWPEERSRKPLWADFIPEEKVREWIKIEQESAGGGSGRGYGGKRWEVVYEKTDMGGEGTEVHAVMREVGSNGPASNLGQGRGVQGAPLGPRRKEPERGGPRQPPQAPHVPASRSTGSGFLALDSLFRFTTAKPKLYYLPVSKSLAENRLDRLDSLMARRGRYHGGNGDEMRRYTFEDGDHLVDVGPDQFPGGRGHGGPNRYRGGRGYVGRGDGRDRGWRDRRDRW